MVFVYFLKLINNDIYIGSTIDIKKRIYDHKNGRVKATRNLLPLKLKAFIAVSNEHKARQLEKYFKTGSGRAILNKRILSDVALA